MPRPGDDLVTPDGNTSTVRRLYDECLNGKNFAMAETLIAPSFEAPSGTGPEAFLTIIRPLHAAFGPMTFEIEDMVAQGDRVAVRWTMRGTHSGVWAGVAPTEKAIHQAAIVIYQLREGKIVAFWPMVDRLGLALQLGLFGPPQNGQAAPHASAA